MALVFALGRPAKLLALVTGLGASALLTLGCEEAEDGGGGNNNTNTETCPNVLPMAFVSCNEPACSATTATRTYARADLSPSTSRRWLAVTHAGSDLLINENLTLTYARETVGGLSSQSRVDTARLRRRALRHDAVVRAWGPEVYASIFGDKRRARVAAERVLRASGPGGPTSLRGATGTAIAPRRSASETLPPGLRAQQMGCSASAPSCGRGALCVIPEGMTSGTCESEVTLKFRPDPTTPATFETVPATVLAVGSFGAIVVDDDDASALSSTVANTLLDRFERRIAPLDHAFLGSPATIRAGIATAMASSSCS